MSKRKNWVDQLVSERYFVWAVVFAFVVGVSLWAQISLASMQMDVESSTPAVIIHHMAKAKHR